MTPAQLAAIARPDVFAKTVLGMSLYPKQEATLRALLPAGARVAFKSCNEGGKTSRVITAAVLWHLFAYPRGIIKSTSGSWNQIETQLIPKLKSYSTRFPRWRFQETGIQTPDPRGFFAAISTKDPGRFEGAHEDDDSPLLIIVDEAKTVEDGIYEAIERCRPTRLLLASSTGVAEGEFYRAFTTRAKYYTALISQVVTECPHMPAKHIEEITAKWGGRNADLVKSMFWAEFMTQGEDSVITLAALERLLADPPQWDRKPDRKAFFDFAAGGDENVIAMRHGNRVTIVDAWRDKNTMSAVGRFITKARAAGLEPDDCEGDADGLGKPMCDALADAGWPVTEFHGGQAPRFDDHYGNLIAETWFEGNKDIERATCALPDDQELRGQLMSRRKRYNRMGKLCLETKEEMRKRGVPSPDRADAVLGAMRPHPRARTVSMIERNRSLFCDPEDQPHQTGIGGFDAGW